MLQLQSLFGSCPTRSTKRSQRPKIQTPVFLPVLPPPPLIILLFSRISFFFIPIQTSGRLDTCLAPPRPPQHRDQSMLQPSCTLTSSEVIIKELLSKSLPPAETQRLSFTREYIDPTRKHSLLQGAACKLLPLRCALRTLSRTFSRYFLESKGFLGTHFYKHFQNPPRCKRRLTVAQTHTSRLWPHLQISPRNHVVGEFKNKRYRGNKVTDISSGVSLSIGKTSKFF